MIEQRHVVGRHGGRCCLVITQLAAKFRGLPVEFADPPHTRTAWGEIISLVELLPVAS